MVNVCQSNSAEKTHTKKQLCAKRSISAWRLTVENCVKLVTDT